MSDQNTIEFLKIIAPKMESGGDINEDYHDIARSLANKTIDLSTVTTTHLAKTMQLRIEREEMKFKMYKGDANRVCADFTLEKKEEGGKKRYGIDLYQRNWAHDYSIEVFYRNIENGNPLSPEDESIQDSDFSRLRDDILKSVIDTYGHYCKSDKKRLFVGGNDGFLYIGNENVYRDTVIEVLKAFAEYAGDKGFIIDHHR